MLNPMRAILTALLRSALLCSPVPKIWVVSSRLVSPVCAVRYGHSCTPRSACQDAAAVRPFTGAMPDNGRFGGGGLDKRCCSVGRGVATSRVWCW